MLRDSGWVGTTAHSRARPQRYPRRQALWRRAVGRGVLTTTRMLGHVGAVLAAPARNPHTKRVTRLLTPDIEGRTYDGRADMKVSERAIQFISFRAYGTWLRGDERGWQPKGARYGEQFEQDKPSLRAYDASRMRFKAFRLGAKASEVVLESLHRLCTRRDWTLLSVCITETHVHVLLLASEPASKTLGDAKGFATRGLREAGQVAAERPPWSRGGSARTLRLASEVERVQSYIREDQREYLCLFSE